MTRMADECKRWIDGKNGGSEMEETADARMADMCRRCIGEMEETADKCRRWIKSDNGGCVREVDRAIEDRVAGRSGRCIGEVRKGGQKRAEFPRGASQADE